MLYGAVIIIFLLLAFWFFEYRIRKPDQLILFEKNNSIITRKGRFYPRHFSLAMNQRAYSFVGDFTSEAKGHIPLSVRVALSATASHENLVALIRTGGWKENSLENAVNEARLAVEAMIHEFTEKYEVEELQSDKLADYILGKAKTQSTVYGLELLALTVQSLEPQDKEIVTAIKKREEARIKEQTENTDQKARINIAKTKAKADEQIIFAEHELELKKLDLSRIREENESKIAEQRVKDELGRKEMQLKFEQKEMELLKDNPQLLMLSPQLARLAEASQSLPNAKTVVSLSPSDVQKGSQIIEMIQTFLHSVLQNQKDKQKS